jgi:HEAT repeat protein
VGRALEDPDPGVRRAALTVAATSGVATVDVVLPLLDDPDAAVAENAAWALGELPTPGAARSGRRRVEALARTAATHPDALCREAAVAALGAVGDPAGLPAVLAALGDKPAVRRRAVVALAAFDDPRADAALLVAAGDRDRQVRETAEELLAVPPGGGDPGDEPD